MALGLNLFENYNVDRYDLLDTLQVPFTKDTSSIAISPSKPFPAIPSITTLKKENAMIAITV